ncbi:MAG: PAS domain S-box protein [Acidobacteriota bacterium]|nr:PAS domain S-box protein [Acidobacteriota bacterium]
MDLPETERVLVVAPYGRDAELFSQILGHAGIPSALYSDVTSLSAAIRAGGAAAIVADEALTRANIQVLASALEEQPAWSDFPVLLLTGGGEATEASQYRLRVLAPLGNITLIERPLRTSTLLSTVNTALRARRRQYQIRDQMDRQAQLLDTIRENEEKLKFALDAGQLGSWELQLPGMDFRVSEECGRSFGLTDPTALSYPVLLASIHPEDRDVFQEGIRNAFQSHEVYKAEFRIERADGGKAWILIAGRPARDDDGTPRRMLGVMQDISERKKGEEAIRQSESELRALADSIPQMAWIADPTGYIFWYNRRWYEFTGTTLEQMKGWGWRSVHDPSMLEKVAEKWQVALESGQAFEMEFPLRGADGAFRWFLTQTRPVRNSHGEVVRWFGTNTDIDEKRQAEEARKESEELAHSVIESSPECVEVLDEKGRTVLVNRQGWQRRGIKDPESGLLLPWAESWGGEDRAKAGESLQAALGGATVQFRASSQSESEEPIRWDVSLTPIHGADGLVSKVLCIARDVTAALKAEQEMRETAKLESLGVMAGGIAHDFNNLLTGILGNASLLAETVGDSDQLIASDIVLAAERAADLTSQMLAYSGRGRFQIKKLDLSLMVREILRLVRPSIGKNVEIKLDGKDGCMLEGDPGQIQQVIMNLAINAGEAMEGRPGWIEITTGKIRIEPGRMHGMNDLPAGEYAFLKVRDNGKGMDEATKARIFDPFFTTKFAGRGLGLAAVSGIVRGHKGALRVTSVPNEGTTFMVCFPACEPAPRAARKPEKIMGTQLADTTGPTGANILFVDDEDVVQRAGAKILERHGYQVRVARDGLHAVEVFRADHAQIDLIVLDMMMPVMTGEQALEALREIEPEVPVIVCSGYNEGEVARRFSNQKIAAFIQKPYTPALLIEKVQLVLREARVQT